MDVRVPNYQCSIAKGCVDVVCVLSVQLWNNVILVTHMVKCRPLLILFTFRNAARPLDYKTFHAQLRLD